MKRRIHAILANAEVRLFLVPLLAMLSSCVPDGSDRSYRKPDEKTLIGTWKLLDSSRTELQRSYNVQFKDGEGTLIVRKDGSFTAVGIPLDETPKYGNTYAGDYVISPKFPLVNRSGKWALAQDRLNGTETIWKLQITFDIPFHTEKAEVSDIPIDIGSEDGRAILLDYSICDPDDASVRFHRIP